ncbi:thiol:disulfide interchange protein DsbG [Acinetobacter lwoffii]|uniref:thiol:disulfide interchange protein DsbG n=1 Tax=Acinetobacter lwoffii TaxID=28090 RepID=UPI0035BC90A3|nr:Thiol:disulfide interchange protein DsbG precursor [Acinetobacter lwoffii]
MNKIYQVLGAGMFLIMSMHTQANIKQHIEKQGFVFVKQIPAPQGMTGWVGHEDQYSNTVFISNDDKYYIKGELFDAQGKSLSNEQIEKHMKKAVLGDVWKTMEKSTWIQDGKPDAPRVVYVFSDPNCPYCYKFWQAARPWVESGKIQLRHIQVGVIRQESRGQVATLLMSKNPAAVFNDINKNKGKKQLKKMEKIPAKIDANQALMGKYGFFSTPSMAWKNNQGEFKSTQGLAMDVKEIFEQ